MIFDGIKYTHLRIELSSKCNLACQYCRSNSGQEYTNIYECGEISTKKIFEIIDEAEKLGFEIVILTGGGEPFLRKDIFEIIEYGKLPKAIISNGTLLNEKLVMELSKLSLLSFLKISFDGFKAQSELRGKDTLSRVKAAINIIEEYGIPFAINTVLTDINLFELEELYNYIVQTKAFSWGIYPLISLGRTKNNDLASPNITETAKKVALIISKYIKDGQPFDFEVEGFFSSELFDNDWNDSPMVANSFDHPCKYQISAITIRVNGDISQCSRLRTNFGNIYISSLNDILNGKERSMFVNKTISICNACKECNLLPLCSGGCIGRKQIMGIKDDEPDFIACEYAKAFQAYIVPVLPMNIQYKIGNLIKKGDK